MRIGWTKERANEAYDFYINQNESLRTVGARYGVSGERMRQVFNKFELKTINRRRRVVTRTYEELIAASKAGSCINAAKELNICPMTARRLYLQNGLPLPPRHNVYDKTPPALRDEIIDLYRKDEVSFFDIGMMLGASFNSAPPTGRRFIIKAKEPLRRTKGQRIR